MSPFNQSSIKKVIETTESKIVAGLSIDINSPTDIQCLKDKENKGFVKKNKDKNILFWNKN